ncbi:hypothetical protein HZA98_04905 [Candidatus Woesearchaeota archaeon]|nr:hypothetical protein [Candidatus Woesearchaeota archaeon]
MKKKVTPKKALVFPELAFLKKKGRVKKPLHLSHVSVSLKKKKLLHKSPVRKKILAPLKLSAVPVPPKNILRFPEVDELKKKALIERKKERIVFLRQRELERKVKGQEKLLRVRKRREEKLLREKKKRLAMQEKMRAKKLLLAQKKLRKEGPIVTVLPEHVLEPLRFEELQPVEEELHPAQAFEFSQVDPWQKCVELVHKCRDAVANGNFDFAVIYYEEIQPFLDKVSDAQRAEVVEALQEVYQDMEMLELHKLRVRLQKSRSLFS